MFRVECDRCGVTLDAFGGLVFSPPVGKEVKKLHLCTNCYDKVIEFIEQPKRTAEASEAHEFGQGESWD